MFSPMHPGRVWVTFITLDGLADVIACNGAIRAAGVDNSEEAKRIGLALVKLSLFLLIALFIAFICKLLPTSNGLY